MFTAWSVLWSLILSAPLSSFSSLKTAYVSDEIPIRNITEYDFRISWFIGAPNGIPKKILGVNNQFPGPTIRGKKRDLLRVRVTNAIQSGENVTIHWHGMHQFRTPFQDGTDKTSQCPLVYGQTQLYEFQLLQTGTHWWHTHYGPTLPDGLWGILIVDNDPEVYKDLYDHELVISIADWFLKSGQEMSDWYFDRNNTRFLVPHPHSYLMNGEGYYPCEYAEAQGVTCTQKSNISAIFEVPYGSAVRVRFISTSSHGNYMVSIDNHTLQCIETDGVDTELGDPVDQFRLNLAMRYSFLVNMNSEGSEVGSEFLIRVIFTGLAHLGDNINPFENFTQNSVFGLIRYVQGSGIPRFANTTNEHRVNGKPIVLVENKHCIALRNNAAPDHFDQEISVIFDHRIRTDGSGYWTTNGIQYGESSVSASDGELPAFMRVMRNETIPDYMVPIYTSGNGSVIQLVVNNHHTSPHPVHLHGHSFWIVGAGDPNMGDYIAKNHYHLLKEHVAKRDVTRVQPRSWLVLRYIANNPGTWFLHCHVNMHIKGGMAATIVEGFSLYNNVLMWKPE